MRASSGAGCPSAASAIRRAQSTLAGACPARAASSKRVSALALSRSGGSALARFRAR